MFNLRESLNPLLNKSTNVKDSLIGLMEKRHANSTTPIITGHESDVVYNKPTEPDPIKFGLGDMPKSPRSSIDKSKLVFQEYGVNSGIPYVDEGDKRTRIDEIDFEPPETKKIKKIVIKDPRDGHSKEITDPEELKVANEIKRVADAVAPEYTDYLLRLGSYEGLMRHDTKNDNGEKGVDRGIFQINNKAFPQIPDEFANDVRKSTLWAIALIEAGKQDKWVADPFVKKAKTDIEYE